MNWLERKADDFIRRIRDANPIGVDPKNPIAIGGKKVLVGDPPPPKSGSNTVGAAFRIENPTYWRWFVVPRNDRMNVYLHNFLRDDEEDLHDHRMINISVVLCWPGYREEVFVRKPREGEPLPPTRFRRVIPFVPRIRFPSTPHRVVLYRNKEGKPIPIWSLFVGFMHWRNWGFWCPGKLLPASNVGSREQYREKGARWVPWEPYVLGSDPTSSDYGTKGAGCDG